jgi:Domain of unknown function (DUF6249)
MKRSILLSSLICLTASILLQAALAQTPATIPPEASPTQEAAAPTGPVPTVPPVQAQPYYTPTPETPNLQEQLKWAEQRASMSEEMARGAQRTIPMLILLILFTLPVAFAGGVFFARYRNYQQLNETLCSLMEKGVAIPPELLTPRSPSIPRLSDFRKGLLLIWSGIGAVFLLGILLHGNNAWSLGLIPVFTGLAYLVLWKIERRKETA